MLIHRDTVNPPFFPGNITRSQRIHLLLSASTKNTKSIRPRMDNKYLMYMVEAGIGKFAPPHPPHYKYFLHLDTGSDLIWTQCEDCKKWGRASCFLQKAPLFPAGQSHTYRPLPRDKHALCSPGHCINTTYSYLAQYGDGAMSLGYLANESFTFQSDNEYKKETIRDLVFGCGIKNQGFVESSRNNLVAGNFGLGEGNFLMLKQKKELTQGRSSYCLPPWDVSYKSTIFLRFGADIPQRKGLQVTPLSTSQGFTFYYVDLKGISVGNRRVDIPEGMLARKRNNFGGCIVDSGRLEDHPNITFHLQGADLVFWPQVGYLVSTTRFGKTYFCLAMCPGDIYGMTIIGALQQADTRFVFDTLRNKLYFGPEDCTRSAQVKLTKFLM